MPFAPSQVPASKTSLGIDWSPASKTRVVKGIVSVIPTQIIEGIASEGVPSHAVSISLFIIKANSEFNGPNSWS